MRQRRSLLLILTGCWAWGWLGASLVTSMAGCGDTAGARPKRIVRQVPPPGRTARPSPPPSVPPEARPATAESPAAFASRHQPYVEGECQTCHGNDKSGALRPDFMTVCRDCHQPLFDYHRFGHSPTVVGACQYCHLMHESENDALLKSAQRELCISCHPMERNEPAMSDYHQGIEALACTACHDPHFADNYLLLKPGVVRREDHPAETVKDSGSAANWQPAGYPGVSRLSAAILGTAIGVSARPLVVNREPSIVRGQSPTVNPQSAIRNLQSSEGCLAADCHAELAAPKYLHGPLALEECACCHEETDKENHKYRLPSDPPELCFGCHAKLEARLRDKSIRPNHHSPVDEGLCLECHHPHASGLPMLLREDSVVELCMGCHEDDVPLDGRVHRPIEKEGEGCIACHRGHDSEHPTLLRQPGGDLCLRCHQDTNSAITTRPHVHPPAGDKECGACHAPHASEHGNLLVERLAAGMYLPYDDGESYALCFQCHDVELVEEEESDEYTEFRNGERNLHHLHVNKPSKGRSCRTCHLPHASAQHRLIRSELTFGKWELSIGYLPTDTGGYCGPACHPAKRYDRMAPVDFDQEPVAPPTGED